MRVLGCLAALLAATVASAQGARVAIHPLELREMTAAQQEVVQAQFDVMLARTADLRLAGSTAIEDALLRRDGQGCELRDECLRYLASATDSLYAVYVRLRPDPLATGLLVTARVVRSDGAVMRAVSLGAPLSGEVELVVVARGLLARLLEELRLGTLSPTVGVEPIAAAAGLTSPATHRVEAKTNAFAPAGYSLLGVGAITVLGGVAVACLAAAGRGRLTPDPGGAVPAAQARSALEVAREGQAATVLIPLGAVISLVGGALAFWPTGPAAPEESLR